MLARILCTFFGIAAAFAVFALPVAAAELECNYEQTRPAAAFIEVAGQKHPNLDVAQTHRIARMYELAYNQQELANDMSNDEQVRAFAERTLEIAMKTAAVTLFAFDSITEMESVLEKMEAEKAAGLERVSAELEPHVRSTGHKLIVVGLTWNELVVELTQLDADRFIAMADQPGPDVLEAMKRNVCSLRATVDVMEDVGELFSYGVMLATAEYLYY